ncbi:MAG: DHH family phosphoesterase [Patescibacteria group bacterium]
MNFTEKLQLAYQKLQSARQILLIGHVSPDADALASIGAMLEVTAVLGSTGYAYAANKPAGAYGFIPNERLITDEEPVDLRAFDVIVILDCGSISRTGLEIRLRTLLQAAKSGRLARRPYLIEFDHHLPQEAYADLEIRCPDKASTTEIIYHFLKINGLAINKALANCILIGLMTDTGHFLHANSSREALAVSSEMLLRGASLPKIIENTVNNKSFAALKVWGRALENMRLDPVTGLAASALTAAEISELLHPADAPAEADLYSDIVSFLSTLSGVRVALLLREEGETVKGSLRTTDNEIDLARIAQQWGGGGHRKAAGFKIKGRLARTATGWKVVK